MRDLGLRMTLPIEDVVRVTVERAAVTSLGLEEDDRVVALDGAYEESLGVERGRAVRHFKARCVGELRLW